MIVNYYPGGTVDRLGAPVKYTGTFYVKVDENNQENWECYLLTDGELTVTKNVDVDIFLVGGGGGGAGAPQYSSTYMQYGYGGAGGRTDTESNQSLLRGIGYTVVIGAGGSAGTYPGGYGGAGEATTITADNSSMHFEADGGEGGGPRSGLKPIGGRSGGIGAIFSRDDDGGAHWIGAYGGEPYPGNNYPTQYSLDAQVSAFGEQGTTPYAGGGAGGGLINVSTTQSSGNIGGEGGGGYSCHDGLPNTGGGGGGGYSQNDGAGNGGSGIIIIRNHRTIS